MTVKASANQCTFRHDSELVPGADGTECTSSSVQQSAVLIAHDKLSSWEQHFQFEAPEKFHHAHLKSLITWRCDCNWRAAAAFLWWAKAMLLFLLVLLLWECLRWGPLKDEQSTQCERDAHPPQSCMGFSKKHLSKDGLDTPTNRDTTWVWMPKTTTFAAKNITFHGLSSEWSRWMLEHCRGAESLLRRWSWMLWKWRWLWLRKSSVGEPWRRRSTWRHYRRTSGPHTAAAGGCGAAHTQVRWGNSRQLWLNTENKWKEKYHICSVGLRSSSSGFYINLTKDYINCMFVMNLL